MSNWRFITNHGLILATIAKGEGKTAREIGDSVGVTERTAHKIIIDLEKDGYIIKNKIGNKNTYTICTGVPLKTTNAEVGELLNLLVRKSRNTRESNNHSLNPI